MTETIYNCWESNSSFINFWYSLHSSMHLGDKYDEETAEKSKFKSLLLDICGITPETDSLEQVKKAI